MKLPELPGQDLLQWLPELRLGTPPPACLLTGVSADSRAVGPGFAFLVTTPAGHPDYAAEALARGARVVLREGDDWAWEPMAATGGGLEVFVPALRVRLDELGTRFYRPERGWPRLYGVTGTNGKSTVSFLLAQALERLGQPAAVLGTLGAGDWRAPRPTGFTTPDGLTLRHWLAALAREGAQGVALEVSSHALAQGRARGLHFAVAGFTQLSRDHLDYHGDLDRYFAAKARLFSADYAAVAAFNLDCPWGRRLAGQSVLPWWGYGLESEATAWAAPPGCRGMLRASRLRADALGQTLRLRLERGRGQEPAEATLESALVGGFNGANLLAAAAMLMADGFALADVVAALREARPPPGRLEVFSAPDHPLAVVDYAHSPDGLRAALAALRPLARAEAGQRLWVVFGAGGDRDAGKRPLMGEAATAADVIVLTDDNPRSENPAAIRAAIRAGIPAGTTVHEQGDRGEAIAQTIASAKPGDVVLIAGKGHETEQIIGGERRPFSDREQVCRALGLAMPGGRP